MTSKQRAKLRGLANDIETILHVGKNGVTDTVCSQADEALEKRELIKGRVLDASFMTSREAAEEIAERVGAEVVQVIGTRFVLYRMSKDDPKIEL